MRSLDQVGLHIRPSYYAHADIWEPGIKEYSEWPTIPQLYVDKEFVGGTDILMSMHQDGSLAKLLEEKDVLVPAE
jgi:glutaredoxin-related protein